MLKNDTPGHINGSKPYKNVNFDSINVFERGSSVNFDNINGSCTLNVVNALTFKVNVLTF